MKTQLLILLMFPFLYLGAQTNSAGSAGCNVTFEYEMLLQAYPVNGIVPNTSTFQFKGKSDVNVTAWFWDFGDGKTSSEQNPVHVFQHPVGGPNIKISPYSTITLTILSAEGCKVSDFKTINIFDGSPLIPADFKAWFSYSVTNYDTIRQTATVQFKNLSVGDTLKYNWKFDDEKTSTDKEPTVTFDLKHEKTIVCLTVTNKKGSTDQFCDVVYLSNSDDPIVINSCVAQFTYKVNNKIMTLLPSTAIDFYDKSEGKVKAWYWKFGDGSISTEQNPTHVFSHNSFPITQDSGKTPYTTVSLTITTSDGCTSYYSEDINILDGTPYVRPLCSAKFTYFQNDYDILAGTSAIQFVNFAEGDSLQYFWKFDNVKTSNDKEPVVTFDLKKKVHFASLTVKGAKNCSDFFSDSVYLHPYIDFPIGCDVYFNYSVNYKVQTLLPSLVLDFYSKSPCEVKKWLWNFGDGKTSDEANPTHIFELPQSSDNVLADPNPFRKVCLTIITDKDTMTYCETINLYMDQIPDDPEAKCHAWFKYSKMNDMVTIPEVVPYKFQDVSKVKVLKRFWHFGNGQTSTEAEPVATFNIFEPVHEVCLTIFTEDNCITTWCEKISLYENGTDTSDVIYPNNIYSMRYTAGFPPTASSCAGWATAQVYMKDKLVKADNYSWSTGDIGQEVKGLCPTQTYTVKAITPEGELVSGSFVFNSDGTVTEIPMIWWVDGNSGENPVIQSTINNDDYSVYWRLCDGTLVKSDTISLSKINCGGKESNMILKDASGNTVFAENISAKSIATAIKPIPTNVSVALYPNPVSDVLNLRYSGSDLEELQLEILDLSGKRISVQRFNDVEAGQTLSINVNTLIKGVYFCKLMSDNQNITVQKFVK